MCAAKKPVAGAARAAGAPRSTGSDATDRAAIARTPTEPAYLSKPHHLHTLGERMDAGRALRGACPREDHAGWVPPADRPIADFTVAYADQNERDHAALVEAVRAGRLEAYVKE
jgi:hypothetical protein